MFICESCGEEAILIRNQCESCAPAIHENHSAWMEFMAVASDRYKEEVGQDSLANWYDFENFLETRVGAGELQMPADVLWVGGLE